jgi:hypothetical protein
MDLARDTYNLFEEKLGKRQAIVALWVGWLALVVGGTGTIAAALLAVFQWLGKPLPPWLSAWQAAIPSGLLWFAGELLAFVVLVGYTTWSVNRLKVKTADVFEKVGDHIDGRLQELDESSADVASTNESLQALGERLAKLEPIPKDFGMSIEAAAILGALRDHARRVQSVAAARESLKAYNSDDHPAVGVDD